MFDDDVLGHRRNMLYEGTDVMGSGSIPATDTTSAAEAQLVLTPSVNPVPAAARRLHGVAAEGLRALPSRVSALELQPRRRRLHERHCHDAQNGNNIPTTIEGVNGPYGDPAIIWVPTLPGVTDGQAWPKPSGDQTYTVTVNNVVVNGGAPQSFTYNTTVIDPSGCRWHAPDRPGQPHCRPGEHVHRAGDPERHWLPVAHHPAHAVHVQ